MSYKEISVKDISFVESILSDKSSEIHIIGAGGVGMSGLVVLLSHLGYLVSASDKQKSTYLDNLSKMHQVKVWLGSNVENLSNTSIIFYSTAIPDSDLERLYALKNQIPIFSRHSLLTFLTKKFYTIAVCGTHGKTTTASWLVHLFHSNQRKVYSLLGGSLQGGTQQNVYLGTEFFEEKPILIIEADESDGSLLYIDADIVCVTNIEMDHPDVYKSIDEVYDIFRKFLKKNQILSTTFLNRSVCISIELKNTKMYDLLFKKEITPFNLVDTLSIQDTSLIDLDNNKYSPQIIGVHNLYNASLVVQLGVLFRFSVKEIQHAISTFLGSKQRMELLGSLCYQNSIVCSFLDDYAHHPNEVYHLILALKNKQEQTKYIFFWEPHRLSRLQYFSTDFIKVFLSLIDLKDLYLLPPFTAGEDLSNFLEVSNILQSYVDQGAKLTFDLIAFKQKIKIDTVKNIMLLLDNVLSNNSKNTEIVCVFMGAGNSSKILKKVVKNYTTDKRFTKI